MPTVFANGRSIVHKGDGLVHLALAPDVCYTPTPVGPVPIPYPNIAKSSDLQDGSKSVKIEGQPIAIAKSTLSQSSGNEAGTAGGVVSGVNRGKVGFATSSSNVLVEGQGVVRFLDVTLHNGQPCNTAGVAMGVPLPAVP